MKLLLPKLLWQLPLGFEENIDYVIIAHSFNQWEFGFTAGKVVKASYLVDIEQGVIWRSEKQCEGTYIARGLCLARDKLVDPSGSVIYKVKFEPRDVRIGRHLVLLSDGLRAKIIDRHTLTTHADIRLKKERIILASDEYTLAMVVPAKGSKRVFVDTIHGLTTITLKHATNVKASRGCVVVCSMGKCIVTNGLIETEIPTTLNPVQNIEPLAATRAFCIIAINTETQWVIVRSSNEIEPLDFCREKPEVVYSDDKLLIYQCDDEIHMLDLKGSEPPQTISYPRDHVVLTPSYILTMQRQDGLTLLEGHLDDVKIRVPALWFKPYNNRILVLTDSWLYSIDLTEFDELDINETFYERHCLIKAKIHIPMFKIIDVQAEGEVDAIADLAEPSTVELCLNPSQARLVHNMVLRLALAPPLILEHKVKLEFPKPRVKAMLIEMGKNKHIVDRSFEIRSANTAARLGPGTSVLVIHVDDTWFKTFRDKVSILVITNEGSKIAEQLLKSNPTLIPIPVDKQEFKLMFKGEELNVIPPLQLTRVTIDKPLVKDVNVDHFDFIDVSQLVVKVRLETLEKPHDIHTSGATIYETLQSGEETMATLLIDDIYGRAGEIRVCKGLDNVISLCEVINLKSLLSQTVLSRLPTEAEAIVPRVYQLMLSELSRARITIPMKFNGDILPIKFVIDNEIYEKVVVAKQLDKGLTNIEFELPGFVVSKIARDKKVIRAVIQLALRDGVRRKEFYVALYIKPRIVVSYANSSKYICSSENTVVIYKGKLIPPLSCLKVDDLNDVVVVDVRTGEVVKPNRLSIDEFRVIELLKQGVRDALVLAATLGIVV